MSARLTIAMLRAAANFGALMMMADRTFKECDQVIAEYKAFIAQRRKAATGGKAA
jgi:hypothetical protein